jgi:hypothetical protein
VGQAIGDVQGDVHAGFRRGSGEALGIAEQQIGCSYVADSCPEGREPDLSDQRP